MKALAVRSSTLHTLKIVHCKLVKLEHNDLALPHYAEATRLQPERAQLRANYAAAGVAAELVPFIDDTAAAFAAADLVVCREIGRAHV